LLKGKAVIKENFKIEIRRKGNMLGLITYYSFELTAFKAVENDYKDVTVFAKKDQDKEVYNFLDTLISEGWEVGEASDTDGNLFWVCSDENGNAFTVFTEVPTELLEI
jgi:hypothetical protein